MEEYLKRFQPKKLRPELRDKILDLARREQPEVNQPVIDGFTSRWSSWAGTAAAIFVVCIFNMYLEDLHEERVNEISGLNQILIAEKAEARKLATEVTGEDTNESIMLAKRFELEMAMTRYQKEMIMQKCIISIMKERIGG
jgi:hypothetical protein